MIYSDNIGKFVIGAVVRDIRNKKYSGPDNVGHVKGFNVVWPTTYIYNGAASPEIVVTVLWAGRVDPEDMYVEYLEVL